MTSSADKAPGDNSKNDPHTAGPRPPFQAIPAVDLKGGRCVQLVGGRPEEEKVSLPDPVAVARGWWETGFRTLHVVDLDAALGTGDNRKLVEIMVQELSFTVQVGGGIRSQKKAQEILGLGVERIIVGTRAVEDPVWLGRLSHAHPGRVAVAADIRDGMVLSKGWTEESGRKIEDFLRSMEELPLAGVLCTDVSREGKVQGMDRPGVRRTLQASVHPVWISGGVSSMADLRFLDEEGAAGAVLGMALYTGALNANQVAKEFVT